MSKSVNRTTSTMPVAMKSETKSKPGKRVLHEMTIRPVANGFMVKKRFADEGKEPYMSNHADEEHAFESADDAMSHMSQQIGAKSGETNASASKTAQGKVEKTTSGAVVGKSDRP